MNGRINDNKFFPETVTNVNGVD